MRFRFRPQIEPLDCRDVPTATAVNSVSATVIGETEGITGVTSATLIGVTGDPTVGVAAVTLENDTTYFVRAALDPTGGWDAVVDPATPLPEPVEFYASVVTPPPEVTNPPIDIPYPPPPVPPTDREVTAESERYQRLLETLEAAEANLVLLYENINYLSRRIAYLEGLLQNGALYDGLEIVGGVGAARVINDMLNRELGQAIAERDRLLQSYRNAVPIFNEAVQQANDLYHYLYQHAPNNDCLIPPPSRWVTDFPPMSLRPGDAII